MKPTSKLSFLKTAVSIGDYLVDCSGTSGNYTGWKTINKISKTATHDVTSIYAGSTGIALFLLELYRQVGQEKYLRTAIDAISCMADKEQSRSPNPSFIAGSLGVAYGLAKVYEITGSRTYLQRALALAESCCRPPDGPNEYITGNAGTLLGLLHLHAISNASWLLEAINAYTGHLLRSATPVVTGIYWDRNPQLIQPLCGFSHGVAGIGFVFLELGRYLKNPAYYTVSEQAFAYENACFDKTLGEWPDFRITIWKPQHVAELETAYVQGRLDVFTQTDTIHAWCHGAPGIGLSRIRAYKATGKSMYLQDLDRALSITETASPKGLSLCHGEAGNIDLFIESHAAFGREHPMTRAYTRGRKLISQWEAMHPRLLHDQAFAEQEPLDLFMGIAGVGYSLLRLFNPDRVPSILAPSLPTTPPVQPDPTLQFLRLSQNEIQEELGATGAPLVRHYKHQMEAQYPNCTLLFIKSRVRQKALQKLISLNEDELMEHTLQLDEDCRLHITPQNKGLLLRYTAYKIEQKDISSFCHAVLSTFKKPRKVREAIDAISRQVGTATQADREIVRTKSIEQIRQALQASLLFSVYDEPSRRLVAIR